MIEFSFVPPNPVRVGEEWKARGDTPITGRGRFTREQICERDLPLKRRRLVEMNGKTFLRETDFTTRITRHSYNRETWLLRPGCGDFSHGLSRGFGERIPKIGGSRVRKFVGRDVFANAVPKNIFSQKALKHPDE